MKKAASKLRSKAFSGTASGALRDNTPASPTSMSSPAENSISKPPNYHYNYNQYNPNPNSDTGTDTGSPMAAISASEHEKQQQNQGEHVHANGNGNDIGKKTGFYIGSKTELVHSPSARKEQNSKSPSSSNNNSSSSSSVRSNQPKSIQLAPEPPKLTSPKKALLADSTTTSPIFRNDVKQEWINAIFGPDFFPIGSTGMGTSTGPADYVPPREGMGLANIPNYLSYTVCIPSSSKDGGTAAPDGTGGSGSGSGSKNTEKNANGNAKVGVTLSRIPIGVYVRMVDIGSEAYNAGIVPGSVLVDINGMGVLGEPSHKLLERLWVYEGQFRNIMEGNFHHLGILPSNSFLDESKTSANGSTVQGSANHRRKKEEGKEATTLNGPACLTFIKDGQLYTATLLSSPPFGISWAPCANFALVQRSYSHAQKAGLRRGCIVASVNHKSLREMDHLDTAMELKEQFQKGRDIRMVCMYTPARSRTNYYKAKNGDGANPNKKNNEFKTMDGVKVRKVNLLRKQKQKQLLQKGKKKEKPMEYGVGSFFTCGTGANYTPIASGTEHDFISDLANRVAAGEVAAPTGMKVTGSGSGSKFEQMLLEKSAAVQGGGDKNKSPRSQEADQKILMRSLVESHERYNDCPVLGWDEVSSKWDRLDALVYCLRMHAAGYDEEEFHNSGGVIGASKSKSMQGSQLSGQTALWKTTHANAIVTGLEGGVDADSQGCTNVALHSVCANLNLLKAVKRGPDSCHVIRSFLLQIVALIASAGTLRASPEEEKGDIEEDKEKAQIPLDVDDGTKKICEEIIGIVVDISMGDDDLCQSLHFLLRSFRSTYAKFDSNADVNIAFLTFAHRLLRNRLIHRGSSGAVDALEINSPDSTTDSMFDYQEYSLSTIGSYSENDKAKKTNNGKRLGKRIGKMFRVRSKSKGIDASVVDDSEFSVSVTQSDVFEADSLASSPVNIKKTASKKKLGFMPTSILRKAADQAPQDNGFGNGMLPDVPPTAILFENMGLFLSNLDKLCGNIEQSLLKSFSQKITEWALQPWSANKGRALSESTADLRNGLRAFNEKEKNKSTARWSPVLNPMDSSELLIAAVPEESYILPSAHFPLLLSFCSCPNSHTRPVGMLHRTQVKVVSIRGDIDSKENKSLFVVQASIGGVVKETGPSALEPYYGSTTHRWHEYSTLDFESRLSFHPSTVELRLISTPIDGVQDATGSHNNSGTHTEVGFALIDIRSGWTHNKSEKKTYCAEVMAYNNQEDFDQSGLLEEGPMVVPEKLSIELEITTESIPLCHGANSGIDHGLTERRLLLYKHDEDMRQEMLAIQFLEICDHILKSSGLDLKLKKYKCIPVGESKGFIEWVPGAISLSELCKPMGEMSAGSPEGNRKGGGKAATGPDNDGADGSGEDKSAAFVRVGGWCKHESLRGMRHEKKMIAKHGIGLSGNNPIQEFLRGNAYDPDAPYLIRKDVMDNFVKSCAGYCVVTYLLGVGDRHTDNLLLHPQGYFLHCDYSFILGQDPKTFLPMRITEHMVNGMGGRDSDNFAKFLSLAGAAFVSLRQSSSVRTLMTLVQGMLSSHIPDISVTQSPSDALQFIYKRFCLDLNDDDAVAFLEDNIERSLTSKIWIAVDTIHSLGKHF